MEMKDEHLDEYVKKKLTELDKQFPSALGSEESLWERIEEKMEPKRKSHFWSVASIAASVLLAVLAVSWWILDRQESNAIVFRTEMQDTTIVPETQLQEFVQNKEQDSEALHFILDQCAVEQKICDSEGFKEMKKQFEEVNTGIADLNKQLDLYGPDPNLVRARISLENQKAYIMNELIQQIKS
jgi:hypothetical protein